MQFKHVMIDIETMGTSAEAAIVSIGAVLFDPDTEQLGPKYYAKVLLSDAVANGGKIDAETVIWWLKQDDAARSEITNPGRVSIDIALAGLWIFITDNTDEEHRQVWANGASFDLPILSSAFARGPCYYGAAPWKFWQERCYRTLKNIRPDIKAVPQTLNVKHNALDDAKTQALHAIALLRAIAPQPEPAMIPGDTLDDDHPLWLVNEQIKGLLEGDGASEDHENVLQFWRRTGLPAGTIDRMHRAIVHGDAKTLSTPGISESTQRIACIAAEELIRTEGESTDAPDEYRIPCCQADDHMRECIELLRFHGHVISSEMEDGYIVVLFEDQHQEQWLY